MNEHTQRILGNKSKAVDSRDALAELNVDLGGYRTHFTPPSPLGSRFVDVVAIDRNGRIIG